MGFLAQLTTSQMAVSALQTDNAELIRQCQEGDTSGFDALVREHYALAYNTAYRMLGDQEQAADATQAAFVRAFRSLRNFRGDAAFSTWLYRIVINVCLDQMRQTTLGSVSLTFGGGEDEEAERPLSDPADEPIEAVQRRQRQQAVHEALSKLAPEHRSVLVLYDLAGLAYDDIAYILQVPLGTVKSRLNRARHALKEVLAPSLELFD